MNYTIDSIYQHPNLNLLWHCKLCVHLSFHQEKVLARELRINYN